MTNFRRILWCTAVAAFAFAASASATTVLVTDEYGSAILDGTMLVTPMGGVSLSNQAPAVVEARPLLSGGYVVSGVTGPAHIEFTHQAYGTLESKAIFGSDVIELVIGGQGRGYAMLPAGMEFDKSVPDATRNTCAAADALDWNDITDGDGLDGTFTTSGNNSNVNCGISGSDWHGVFTAGNTQSINLTTCLAGNGPPLNLDTILAVRTAANCVSGPSIACDDDSCPGLPGFTFNSILGNVPVTAGQTYNVVVDRWASTANMTFDIHIGEPFELDPPEGGCIDENEPACGLSPIGCSPLDFTNGGCNFTPALFSEVACGDTYCSTYGNCGNTRDTDWYRYQETSIRILDWCCIAEGAGLFGWVASNHTFGSECPATAFIAFALPPEGEEVCVTQLAFPGSWLAFGATSNFGGQPCGLEYQCRLDCTCPAPCDGDGGGASSAGAGALQGGGAARARY